MDHTTLDDFTRAYFEAALWSTTDNATEQGGEPLDANYSISDIADETAEKMVADCARFQADHAALLHAGQYVNRRTTVAAAAGHDFWLTRNHHGAGFWDGDWDKSVGEQLTAASHAFGEIDLYVGDDGKIYS